MRPYWVTGWAVLGLAGCQPALVVPPPVVRPVAAELSLVPAEESATLEVGVTSPGHSVQALPGAWDTATLHLTHPIALRSPRTVTLAKGVQLTANGSGGYTAAGAFGLLRPALGYTLTVSLWNGGAGGTLVGEKQVSLNLVAGANAVTVPLEVYPALSLTGFSPAYGFVGDSVTLSGQGFSVLSSQDALSLGGLTATVSAAASVSLTATVPEVSASSANWQLQVGSSLAGRTGFSILGALGSILSWVTTAASQLNPALVMGSTEYFVAWQDDRLGAANHGIYGWRVGTGGSLAGAEVTVANGAGHQRFPEVAFNSGLSQYAVLYEDSAGSGDAMGQIVNANGTLSGGPFIVANGAFAQFRPQVTYNPVSGQYAAVWTEERAGDRDVYGLRLTGAGAPVGGATLVDGGLGAQEYPAIAANPATGNMLIVWEDTSSGVRRLQGLVSSSTATLVAGPFDLTPTATAPQVEPRVAVDTTNGEFLVVWISQSSPQQVLAQRVSNLGALVGASFAVGTGAGAKSAPRLAYQAYRQKFLVTWTDDRNGNADLYGQYAGADGTLWGGNFAVAAGTGNQGPGAVAVDPATKLAMVAFQDGANAGDLKAQRVR